MRSSLKHLSTVVAIMFLSLMISATMIQVFQAPKLNADSRNYRTTIRQNIANRGPIMIGKEAIASSIPVQDRYRYLREYSNGKLYSAVTGYYAPTLNTSRGIESSESSVLTGTDDSFILQRLRTLISGQESQGGSVTLTLNSKVQEAAYQGLGEQKGAAVAINPRTGEILALVSTPAFDPNLLSTHDANEAKKTADKLENDPNNPLLNRALQNTYAPGSSFKIITAAAMLEQGLSPESIVEAPRTITLPNSTHIIGNYNHAECGDGSGQVPLSVAFQESCNTPFALGAKNLGITNLDRVAKNFGFGESYRIPLRVVPSTITKDPTQIDQNALMMTGFGQHDVQMTPMQGAMVAAAVANNGVLMKPYLISTELSSDLSLLSSTKPEKLRIATSPEVANQLKSMMVDVFTKGIAQRLQIPGVTVAGKSGTAQTSPDKPPHSWMLAFAPAEDPQIAVAVFVENSGDYGMNGTGVSVAGPIARSMIKAALEK